jgi:hypothetical protein
MARPIADTPTLRGMEALYFMQEMEKIKKVSKKHLQEIEEARQWFKQHATFPVL